MCTKTSLSRTTMTRVIESHLWCRLHLHHAHRQKNSKNVRNHCGRQTVAVLFRSTRRVRIVRDMFTCRTETSRRRSSPRGTHASGGGCRPSMAPSSGCAKPSPSRTTGKMRSTKDVVQTSHEDKSLHLHKSLKGIRIRDKARNIH